MEIKENLESFLSISVASQLTNGLERNKNIKMSSFKIRENIQKKEWARQICFG